MHGKRNIAGEIGADFPIAAKAAIQATIAVVAHHSNVTTGITGDDDLAVRLNGDGIRTGQTRREIGGQLAAAAKRGVETPIVIVACHSEACVEREEGGLNSPGDDDLAV